MGVVAPCGSVLEKSSQMQEMLRCRYLIGKTR